MKILGIETSCDDTGVAVLEAELPSKLKILSNVLSSQVKLHAQYGGVFPTLAKREHQKNLPVVLRKALKQAGNPKVDAVAVTVGPGLEPCLWVGVNFAKELAEKLRLPIIPVNHMEGHLLANFIGENFQTTFPAIGLAVSGGHTQLILMRMIGKYKILGETRDDAAGECFDKTARILGLGYPGGPTMAKQADQFKQTSMYNKYTPDELLYKLPRPMMYQKNYDFSFSGLKTAVLYRHRNQRAKIKKSKQYIQAMCQEIQQAIIDVLIHKTMRAAKEFNAKSIILGGGVAANDELRRQFQLKLAETSSHLPKRSAGREMNEVQRAAPRSAWPSEAIENCKLKINFLVPPKNLCTDNGAMIAAAGYYKWLRSKSKKWRNINADANLRLC